MGGPFEGFVFANSGFFQKAPWQALEKVVAGGGGVALGFGQPRRHDRGAVGKRKRGEKDVVSAPTHVVVTDNADAATREKLEREYPGARVVTREWVASKRRGDLPTDLQFVASSDMRISSESLSSPMTTVTGNSRWRQARGEVRGRGCPLSFKKGGTPAC